MYFSFRYSQVANWIEQEGTSRAAVEKEPRKSPPTPSCLRILRRHSRELANLNSLSFCITHFTSSTGATTAVTTRPAKAPFYSPSNKLISVLPRMTLQSSQELNMTALTKGMVRRGQQMPLKRWRKPSYLTMLRKAELIVRVGFICMRTFSVSRMYPEQQLATPDTVPQQKSTKKSNILQNYYTVEREKNSTELQLIDCFQLNGLPVQPQPLSMSVD